MASITIRQLDEGVKKRLRLRAARNGRSMEDEVRAILRTAASGAEVQAERPGPAAVWQPCPAKRAGASAAS